jgi:hypothetical protein
VRGLVLERIALSCRATDDRPQHVRNPHPAVKGRDDRAPRSVSARSSQLSCLEVPFAAPDQAPRLGGRKGFDSLARCCLAWCCTKRDDGRFAAACGAEQIPPLVIGRFHSISRWNDRSLKKEIRIRPLIRPACGRSSPTEPNSNTAMFRALGDAARLRLLTRPRRRQHNSKDGVGQSTSTIRFPTFTSAFGGKRHGTCSRTPNNRRFPDELNTR